MKNVKNLIEEEIKTDEEFIKDAENSLEIEGESNKVDKKEQQKLTIFKILVRTDKDNKLVKQIRFSLDKKDENILTFKPVKAIIKKDKFKGLLTESNFNEQINLDEIPQKVYDLNSLLNEFGFINVITSYKIFNTKDNIGTLKHYWFLNQKDFDSLYPVDKDNKEIKI